MPSSTPCTICGASNARRCDRCRSAAYCSQECQQTDWRTHKLLCSSFVVFSEDDFASRPSTSHFLAIVFLMAGRHPSLTWVNSKDDRGQAENYSHPILDHLLHIPGNKGYIGRGLGQVRGNVLRGRPKNHDTLHMWFLDPDATPANITTNASIHGSVPTLIGDTWGEFIWKGPIVAVMRAGSDFDPCHLTNITLAAYRDAIDYMGFYVDTVGSMIDGPGQHAHRFKVVLGDKAGKVLGVRVNCRRDQVTRVEPEMVQVAVPKMHPLFNLEGDDPCDIPGLFGLDLVAKPYNIVRSGYSASNVGGDGSLANPLAQVLMCRTTIEGGKWVHSGHWNEPSIGSVLIVDRIKRDLNIQDVTAMASLIKETAIPFISTEDATKPGARRKLLDRLAEAGSKRGFKLRV